MFYILITSILVNIVLLLFWLTTENDKDEAYDKIRNLEKTIQYIRNVIHTERNS